MAIKPNRDDKFARESFTFRRMAGWQMWSLLIICALAAIGLIFWI
ncbi:MAG: hypothetical protein ABJ299_02715 [Nitratireductor sp.]